MAKASKTTKTSKSAKPEKTKASKPASPVSGPLVDPSQSAAAAAAMVAMGAQAVPKAEGTATESSSFKNLKQAMNKPHSQTMGGLLDKLTPSGQKKSNVPFSGSKQIGHNQTFGSDASRRNVPRRTGG